MKKIIFLLLISVSLYSQGKQFQFYRIDGTEIITTGEPLSIYKFGQNYFPEEKFIYTFDVYKTMYSDESKTGILAVVFREFTDIPLYILGNSPTKNQIDQAIKMFDFKKYQKNWQFDYNIKKYIKEGNLKIEDLYKYFGKPDKETNTTNLTFFQYNYPFLSFTIKNGYVLDFLRVK